MITQDQKTKAISRVSEVMEEANQFYNRNFEKPSVSFKLKGRCAGKAIGSMLSRGEVRLNPVLLKENEDGFHKRTIPHEVVHLFCNKYYGGREGHGRNWKRMMRSLGYDDSRCHEYDVSNAIKQTQRQLYPAKCDCDNWQLSKIRRNRIIRSGNIYSCPKCKTKIKLVTKNKAIKPI